MDGLTARQKEIVTLKCANDLTHDEIAYRLGLSTQTVKNHVAEVFRRLRVGSMHAVCWQAGLESGYVRAVETLPTLPAVRPEQV